MDEEIKVGDVVYYQAHGSPNGQHKSEPRPAIVTKIHSSRELDIAVFNPTGMFFNRAFYGGPDFPGSWYRKT
jgi:hypothetical protein